MIELWDKIADLTGDSVVSINHLSDGHFSNWFLVISKQKKYFLRKFKHNIDAYEYLYDEEWSFKNSHYMMSQIDDNIHSYWVFIWDGHVYHLQDNVEWRSIWLENLNDELVVKIATKIAKRHLIGKWKAWEFNDQKKQKLYARSCGNT